MRQTRGLGQVVVIELEGRCDRRIEDDQLVAQDLDLAAAQGAVVGAFGAAGAGIAGVGLVGAV
jgi:ABC-type Na+ transport system ATPase subunit NatA